MDSKQSINDFDGSSDVYFLVQLILCNTFRYDIKGPKTILSQREEQIVGNTVVVKCEDIIRDGIIVDISNDITYLLNLKKKLTEQFRKKQEKLNKPCTKGKEQISKLNLLNATKKTTTNVEMNVLSLTSKQKELDVSSKKSKRRSKVEKGILSLTSKVKELDVPLKKSKRRSKVEKGILNLTSKQKELDFPLKKSKRRSKVEKGILSLTSKVKESDVPLKKSEIVNKISQRVKRQQELQDHFNFCPMKMENSKQHEERVLGTTHKVPTYNSLLSTRKKFSDLEDCIIISSDEDDDKVDSNNNLFVSKNISIKTNEIGDKQCQKKASKFVKISSKPEDYDFFVMTKERAYIINYKDIVSDFKKIKLDRSLLFRSENDVVQEATLIFISFKCVLKKLETKASYSEENNNVQLINNEMMDVQFEDVSEMMKKNIDVEIQDIDSKCFKTKHKRGVINDDEFIRFESKKRPVKRTCIAN